MMYIDLINPRSGSKSEYIWHVGQELNISREDIHRVTEIQADGDELQYILNHYINIPKHDTRRVQRWYGDDAKFIVSNITTR